MKIKRTILTILLIIWSIVIFLFSNQSGTKSENVSNQFTIKVVEITSKISDTEYTEKEKEEIIKDYRLIIRKSAHLFIYLILGVLTYMTLDSYNIRHKFLYSLIYCLLYAIGDEIHQNFIDDRSPKLLDILIDFCGSLIGCFMIRTLMSKRLEKIDKNGIILN